MNVIKLTHLAISALVLAATIGCEEDVISACARECRAQGELMGQVSTRPVTCSCKAKAGVR